MILLSLDSSHRDESNECKIIKIQSLVALNVGVCRISDFWKHPCSTQFWPILAKITYKLYTNSNVTFMRDVRGPVLFLLFLIKDYCMVISFSWFPFLTIFHLTFRHCHEHKVLAKLCTFFTRFYVTRLVRPKSLFI